MFFGIYSRKTKKEEKLCIERDKDAVNE